MTNESHLKDKLVIGGQMTLKSRIWTIPLQRSVNCIVIALALMIICEDLIADNLPDFKRHDDLFSVHFASENEGWACGRWGTVLHTADGGKNWQRQETATDYTLSAIHFVDGLNGWAVGDGGTILHTSTGGRQWEKQESPISSYHYGIYFADPKKGWIISEETHILFTEDGGDTWQVQFADEWYKLKGISFADEKTGWAVGEFGFIYGTQDGGKSWKHQSGHYDYNDDTGDIETGVFLFDVAAINPKTAIAVGADGIVRRTDDGGSNWETVYQSKNQTRFFSVAYDGKDSIVICGQGEYLLSKDRGRIWLPITNTPSMKYSWLYGACSIKDRGFVGVGEEGRIYISNSNEKWKRVDY